MNSRKFEIIYKHLGVPVEPVLRLMKAVSVTPFRVTALK